MFVVNAFNDEVSVESVHDGRGGIMWFVVEEFAAKGAKQFECAFVLGVCFENVDAFECAFDVVVRGNP